jgi:hypothetical protein
MSNKGKYTKPKRNFVKGPDTSSKAGQVDMRTNAGILYKGQNSIDEFNHKLITEPVDEFFSDVMLAPHTIVFRPFKENYVKEYEPKTKTITKSGFRQIDNRQRSTDQEDYVDTPFRILNAGILISAPAEYLEQTGLSVGDVIYTSPVQWNENRFYINRQNQTQDHVHSQTTWVLDKFEGYFNITQYNITLGVKREVFAEKYMDTIYSQMYGTCTEEEFVEHLVNLEKEFLARQEAAYQEQILAKETNKLELVGQDLSVKAVADKFSKDKPKGAKPVVKSYKK